MHMAKHKYKKEDLEKIKDKLLIQKKRLEKDLGIVADKQEGKEGEYDAKFTDIGSEVDDSVHEVEQYQVNKSVEITLEKQLRDINKTLNRITKGDYGTCKYCDEDIAIDRLKARPTSSSCVSCKKTLTEEA